MDNPVDNKDSKKSNTTFPLFKHTLSTGYAGVVKERAVQGDSSGGIPVPDKRGLATSLPRTHEVFVPALPLTLLKRLLPQEGHFTACGTKAIHAGRPKAQKTELFAAMRALCHGLIPCPLPLQITGVFCRISGLMLAKKAWTAGSRSDTPFIAERSATIRALNHHRFAAVGVMERSWLYHRQSPFNPLT